MDCKAETIVAGAAALLLRSLRSTAGVKSAEAGACGLAQCEVANARQHSCSQQPSACSVSCSDSGTAIVWHLCALRTQQACAEVGAAVIASDTGARFPASANSNNNLAIKRYIIRVDRNAFKA